MRYLVYLLVLTNMAYYVWQQNHGEQIRPAEYNIKAPPLSGDVKKLMLLSERDRSAAAKKTLQDLTLLNEDEEVTVVGSAPSVDRSQVTKTNSVQPAGQKEEALPLSGVALTCYAIGPFQDAEEAAQASARLQQRSLNPALRNLSIELPSRYWVFLPPVAKEELEKITADLTAKGIQDFFVGRGNVISLGIYSRLPAAESRRDQVANLGYGPRIEKQEQARGEYWLDLVEAGKKRITVAELGGFLSQHPTAKLQVISCD